MPGCASLYERYISDYFIETGSCFGNGIQRALDAGFKNIISIELLPNLYDTCKKRFQEDSCVRLVEGDSSLCLYQSIKNIDCRMTFWLDGHYSGAGTAISETNKISPLLEELDQIKSHHRKDHIILIDDMRLWIKEDVGFGSDEIIKKIYDINPNYVISYEDDVCAEKDILIARIV